jgi:hypothetical protein
VGRSGLGGDWDLTVNHFIYEVGSNILLIQLIQCTLVVKARFGQV